MQATTIHLTQKDRPWRLRILAAACLLALAGCAQIPELGKSLEKKPVEQLGTSASFAAPAAAWPQDAWWKTYGDAQLDTLIDEALRDSPDLAVAQARLRKAQGMAQAAGAPLLPQVTGSASVTRQKQSYKYLTPQEMTPQGWHSYGVATLNFSWELDFWGKNHAALAAAISDQEATRAEAAQARLMLTTSIAAAYAELQHLYAVRDTAARAVAVRQKTVELFRRRLDAGLETLSSVRQVEAREAAAEADLLIVEERLTLQRNAIAALMGAGPDRGLAIKRPSAAAGTFGLPQHLALDLLGRRPDIVAARLRAEAAAQRINQSKAGFYPSVNLIAYIGSLALGVNNLARSGSSFGSVGPAVSLPIFNTEALQGNLRGAHAEYDAAVSLYNGTLTNALHEVADAATSRKALEGELQATRRFVAAAADAHRITRDHYRGQLSSYIEVLNAEDNLLTAQRALADMESRALTLDVAMVRALGGGYEAKQPQQLTEAN
jgi:NodT family efflux transporter outer membrane factor (OMF) lipoprotein